MKKLLVILGLLISSAAFAQGAATHGINLTWADSGDPACPCTFNVYRGTTAGGENYSAPVATGLATLNYLDSTGTAGTPYFYTVTAVAAGIESAPSNEATAKFPTVPVSPSSLAATPK